MPKHSLLATVAALCVVVGSVHAQYVEDSIDVGHAYVYSLAYNSREDVLYGASDDRAFFAISCDSNKVVSSFPLDNAHGVVYDSIDNKTYCTQFPNSLLVVDGVTHNRIKSLPMYGAAIPVWDPISDRVYVSCPSAGSVAVVDCATDSLLTNTPVGRWPLKLYINVPGRKLYVLNADDYSVSIVDLNANQVIKTIAIGGCDVNAGYYCPRVGKFYCAGDEEVVVIDGRSDSVVARIPVAEYGVVEAVSGSDKRDVVVVSVYAHESWLYAIDARKDSVVAAIGTGHAVVAGSIYWSPLSDRFYCASSFAVTEVIVLSGDGRQYLMSLPMAGWPCAIAESPVRRRLYVGHVNSRMIYVIRDANTAWPGGQPSAPDTTSELWIDPSPFRGRVAIASGSKVASGVLRVYAEDGRLVRSLNATKSAGRVLRLTWDGRDSRGRPVPPGVYVVEAGPGLRAKVVKLK